MLLLSPYPKVIFMKKTLSILILSALPVLALAAGSHGGGHEMKDGTMMQGHDMSSMKKGDPAMGQPGDPAKVTQTIEIVMEDTMRFTPSRSEEHTSELQSLMRISYAVFCLKKKTKKITITQYNTSSTHQR